MSEILSQIWANIRAHKLRSFLTMFGIMWGIVSITLLSALDEGFLRGNEYVLRELGKNVIIIRNGRTSMQAGGERAGRPVRLVLDDVLALREKSKLLEAVTPELMRYGIKAKSAFNASNLQMSGIWPVFQEIRTIEVKTGRLLSQADCDHARRVAVIGYEACKQLFAERDPTGTQIQLNGIPYNVIGKMRRKDQDSNYTGEDNERLFIPYETMRKDFPIPGSDFTPDSLSAIIAAPFSHVADELTRKIEREGSTGWLEGRGPMENEVRAILGPRHKFHSEDKEALSMWNTSVESAMFSKMIGAMDSFFTSVSIITLALGGIGVMNIMLISVRERTREIGIRKALGATRRKIQWQFLSEGLFLTLISGAMGFAIGYSLCALANQLPLPERFSGMILTWQTSLFSVVALVVVGVAAACYPARRAAALTPIEALRYEL